MPAERRFGMDHEHHEWDPIINRGKLRWPPIVGFRGSRLALPFPWSSIWNTWNGKRPRAASAPAWGGGLGARGWPDYAQLTHREYGHRVGVFRVLDTSGEARHQGHGSHGCPYR